MATNATHETTDTQAADTRAAKRAEIEQSLDRLLDDAGRFLRYRWWAVLLVLLALWYIFALAVPSLRVSPPQPGAVLLFVAQIVFAAGFVVALVGALLWYLGRPRLYWVLPDDAGASFSDYKAAPEVIEAARRIVALLRGARELKEMGGEISQGLLLAGPSGAGKRYLAQCISAGAGTPFAYVSAASVRALFPGMDALVIARLYRKARRLAREFGGCVVFVDALDAIGAGSLSALLTQMDAPPLDERRRRGLRALGLGRGWRRPMLTIGATTALESLDPALLRPGRFDRTIVVEPPSDERRAEVIEYYLSKIPHDDIAMPRLVADMAAYTPATIKHAINEALMIARADGRDSVTYPDVVAARETREYGARYPRSLSLLERRRLAYHEAGHAIAQVYLLPRRRVARATIVKRLGAQNEAFVEARPLEEIVTQSAEEVFARIEVALASRAAEELFLQVRLNGVGDDLAAATQLALRYVAQWGMGETFFSTAALMAPDRLYTDPALREQAERLLRQAYNDVSALLDHRRNAVIAVAEVLLEREELDSDEIEQLVHQAETPTPAQMAALASVAEAALFGASAAIDFQAPEWRLIDPASPAAASAADAAEQTPQPAQTRTPRFTAPKPPNAGAPAAFAASPSQELRADRVIDRAILRAPLRQTILRKTDPDLPAVSGANGANGA